MAADTGTAENSTPDADNSSSQPLPPPAVLSARLQNTSGFYRLQGDALQFAPNVVHAPAYILSRSDRARIALPKDGWDWFDTAEAAYAHHNLPLPQPEQPGRPSRPEPRAAGGSGR